VDIHVENPTKPVDELGITGKKRLSQKRKPKRKQKEMQEQ